ncbi:prepilin peptidase [Vibrio sp. S4M6]|uniref:prepilin peptidase n=1 Tax=Vibrio sinus TaxID=2946865 RepID=UPI00202A4A99|nr:A24 family peptidase [Vibrio sinus]MCL9780661.1 prepilin peptidase [Vibrio sinus]
MLTMHHSIPFILILISVIYSSAIASGLLCVVITRLPIMMSRLKTTTKYTLYSPPSHCTNCLETIPWKNKLPILGYFISKGECLFCGQTIHRLYPSIEIGYTLLTTALFLYYGLTIKFVILALFSFLAIALSVIDAYFFLLPNLLVLFLFIVGIASSYFGVFVSAKEAVLGMVIAPSYLYVVNFIYEIYMKKNGIGFGDIKLIGVLGLFCGLRGIIVVLFISSIVLVIYSHLYTMNSKKRALNIKVPFGPFLLFVSFSVITLSNLLTFIGHATL